MKTILQSPNFKPSDELIAFAKQSVEKLATYGVDINEGRILLKPAKSTDKENKICELKLIISGGDLFESCKALTYEDAVAKTVETIKHQLLRLKEFNDNKTLTRL